MRRLLLTVGSGRDSGRGSGRGRGRGSGSGSRGGAGGCFHCNNEKRERNISQHM